MNAYAEPVVSLDLDLVVATDQRASVERVLAAAFEVARFPHPLEGVWPGSNLRVQFQSEGMPDGVLARQL